MFAGIFGATVGNYIFAAFSVVALLGLSACAVVTLLKGKWLSGIVVVVLSVGLLLPVTAIRLGKPESWWARRFYDDAKLRRAYERHELDRESVTRKLRAAKRQKQARAR